MSIFGITPSRTFTSTADEFDHAIKLVDTTKAAPEQDKVSTEANVVLDVPSGRSSGEELNRRRTRGTLREELVRRKYKKWQEGRFNDGDISTEPSDTEGGRAGTDTQGDTKVKAKQKGRLRDRIPFRSGKKAGKARIHGEYEVDILYENQRGSWLCGIPLYSSKSLLNFDPSAWQTANFKESPVNITNAQLPDPSWQWAWKSWYVDMSHDVDEEGWEYSFGFRHGFGWHGTSPWFHSFVRRRRWLRKRVKKHSATQHEKRDNLGQAHMLTADYFTIHAKRLSRDSSIERSNHNRSSHISSRQDSSDSEEGEEEICYILDLMKALRKASVDREKIEVVKNFLANGGDELYYLPENMPEIMATFIYQASRRQLLAHLLRVYKSTTEHRKKHTDSGEPESDTERRKVDSLLKAVQSAEEHVGDLEFWSDVKATARKGKSSDSSEGIQFNDHAWSGLHGLEQSHDPPSLDDNPNDDKDGPRKPSVIKGIPRDAAISEEPGINWRIPGEDSGSALDKGKAKA